MLWSAFTALALQDRISLVFAVLMFVIVARASGVHLVLCAAIACVLLCALMLALMKRRVRRDVACVLRPGDLIVDSNTGTSRRRHCSIVQHAWYDAARDVCYARNVDTAPAFNGKHATNLWAIHRATADSVFQNLDIVRFRPMNSFIAERVLHHAQRSHTDTLKLYRDALAEYDVAMATTTRARFALDTDVDTAIKNESLWKPLFSSRDTAAYIAGRDVHRGPKPSRFRED